MMEGVDPRLAVIEVGRREPFGVTFCILASRPTFFGETIVWGQRPPKGGVRSLMSVQWVLRQPET